MENKHRQPIYILGLLLCTVLLRFLLHKTPYGSGLANLTPLGAMALFGGATIKPIWKSWLLLFSAFFLSDFVIQVFIYEGKYGILYEGWYWIYAIFLLISIIGRRYLSQPGITTIGGSALAATLLHWLLADGMVWLSGGLDLRTGGPLPRNWDGLLQCYWQGLPFERNFLLGTVLYSTLLFGTYSKVTKQIHSIQ